MSYGSGHIASMLESVVFSGIVDVHEDAKWIIETQSMVKGDDQIHKHSVTCGQIFAAS